MARQVITPVTALRLATLLAITPAGCVVIGTSGDLSQSSQPTTGAPEIDPSRAYRSLSEIEPAVSRPVELEALTLLSERASRQIVKARKLVHEQRYTEAAIELERALRYDPNHPRIHRTLAMLHWQAGNLERAKIHVARALEGNPDDATANYLSGKCHALGGDMASAITAYRTALLCSDFDDDPEIAAMCHYELGQTLGAEGYLQAALEQYAAFEGKASALVGTATHPELAPLLQSNRGSVAEVKSRILERLGRIAQAADVLAPLVAASPGDAATGLRYAGLLMRAGRLDEALAAARAIKSDDDETVNLLFEIHKRAGHPEGIFEDLRSRIADRPDEPRLVLNLAEMLMRLGRSSEARRELEDYLDGHPRAHTVRGRLAEVYVDQSAWNDLLRVCADGIQHHPERTAEWEAKILALVSIDQAVRQLLEPQARQVPAATSYLRGVLAVAAGRLAEAEAHLRRSWADQPGFVPARVALARLYLRKYRYDEAIQVAARSEEDTPEDARLELVLGEVYERLDNLEKAELHFKAAMQLDRTDTQPMLELAKLYQRSGRRLQAQRQLQVLLEKDSDHEAARELLAMTYVAEGKLDLAIQQLEELQRRATTPTTKARCNALLDQRYQRDADAYRQTLLDAMAEQGPDAATWIAVAESYDIDQAPQEKHAAFQRALAVDPDNEQAALGLVETSQRLLAFEEAAEQLEVLLPRRPNRHPWRLTLILLYRIIQDHEAALNLARSAESLEELGDRWRREYRVQIVNTLRLAGRIEEVLSQLRAWAEAQPDHLEWSIRLADEYLRQDQPEQAVAVYETLREREPDSRELSMGLVEALRRAERYDRATQHLLDWLNDDPGNDNPVWALAVVLRDAGQTDAALELVGNQLLHTFKREEFQDLRADLLVRAKRYDECLDLIEVLIDEVMTLMHAVRASQVGRPEGAPPEDVVVRLPDEPFTLDGLRQRTRELRQRLAEVLILARNYRAAEERLTTWLDASGDPVERFELLRRLAVCRQMQGDDSRASEVLARALLLRPNDVTLNNDVAYGWIDRGVRLDEAERMIRYALSRAPRQAAYLDTYGWLLYKKGAFAEAKKWLTRAGGARAVEDPVIFDHLGDTCWRLGESDGAIEYWTAAVEALGKRPEEELASADERRVWATTERKIADARAGRMPALAPLAAEPTERSGGEGKAPDG